MDKIAVRLYTIPERPRFQQGGLAAAAELTRQGGRDEDEVLVHMTPDEFELLQMHWGPPEINPITGLPEYGFLKRLAKKAKKFTKRLLKNPIVSKIAPMALNAFLPGVGGLIGSTLFGAASADAQGGNPLLGAASGALGRVGGNIGGGKEGFMNSIVPGDNPLSALGQSGDFVGPLQEKAGPLSALKGFFTNDAGKPAWGKIAGAAIGGLGLLNSMKPEKSEAVAPSLPEGWNDPLPELEFKRNQMTPEDYRNYGRKTGEHQFFDPNALPTNSPRLSGNASPTKVPPALELNKALPPLQSIFDLALRQQRGFAMGGSTSPNFVRGPGTGRSDEIEALLSDGEYVIDAESVALLGDGSLDAGAKRLDEMRENLRKHKGTALAKGKFSPDAKAPEEYMGKTKKAKGGRMRGDWVERVVEGGKGKGAAEMTPEQRAELKSIQDFMADYRHMVDKKHQPKLKVVKAKGGRIRPKYVTDLGIEDEKVPRYGVWGWDEAKQKYQVVEVGKDPEALKRKHQIEDDVIPIKKSRGGAVKDLTTLANKFEAMVTGGNEIRARQIARRLDSLTPGSSSFLREGFAKGGKVTDLLKALGDRHKSQSPENLHSVAEELRKLKPDSEVLRQYDSAKKRKGKSVKTIGED